MKTHTSIYIIKDENSIIKLYNPLKYVFRNTLQAFLTYVHQQMNLLIRILTKSAKLHVISKY